MMWGGPGAWWPLFIVMPLLMAAAGVTMMMVMIHARHGGGPFRGPGPHRAGREQERDRDQGQAGEDPLAVLRERYARGFIVHFFDRGPVDRLIRTEPPADARPLQRP